MIITRWNPTTSGPLHLGHIYSLLVNEYFAHDVGGKFYVRFDDTSQSITLEMDKPERAKEIMEFQIEIIEWLEVPVDGWSIQSEMQDGVHKEMMKYTQFFSDPYPHTLPTYMRMIGSGWLPYPYTPWETAERVILDHWLKVTHVIRGEEFATEYSLYRYYCELLGFDPPQFIFLPRLTGARGDISKTNGGYTIVEMRAQGYSPSDIKELLKVACLNYWSDDWSLTNLKSNPRVNI